MYTVLPKYEIGKNQREKWGWAYSTSWAYTTYSTVHAVTHVTTYTSAYSQKSCALIHRERYNDVPATSECTLPTSLPIQTSCLKQHNYLVIIGYSCKYSLLSGQFFRKGVEIDEVRKILIMPDKEPVPVMRRPVWSFMEREVADDQLCWTAMNPGYQGDGLIDGKYLDYLVDDVLNTKWSFK